MKDKSTPAFRQRGVALISVLLVVAIATVLASSMMTDQNIRVHRAGNHFDQAQTRQYALGGEELARQILQEDFSEEPGVQHRGQAWASDQLEFEFGEGEVVLNIEDLQGRLNVNSLVAEGETVQYTRARLATLMRQLGLDDAYVARLEDWLDMDQSVRQLGAEDFDYLALEPPYRSGSVMMADSSEIRLLLDMDQETSDRLLPYVTALPDPFTKLNVNTASPVILQSLSTELTLEAAQALVDRRDQDGGFQSLDEFLQLPEMSGVPGEGLGVQSAFFRVSVRARYRERIAWLTSIIQRDRTDGTMRVIYRNMGKQMLPVTQQTEEKEQDNV